METNNKLREAVIETQSVIARCMDILNKIPDECGYGGLLDDVADEMCALRENHIKPALSAPPRNCDKYANHNDAMRAFDAFVREQGKLGFINLYTEAFKWLFAPATEQKGETNGSK